ncbi:hypothetical protein NQZ68_008507 [Dissostichus eleginoides]|nr:hypothetical protein NQZ68_008507 [Dissostichus eleginoides]
MASLSAFVDAPSVSFLDDHKKAQLVDIAEHYKIAVVGSKRKDEIKAVIVSSLFEQGVLQKSEFGAAGVVPVVVQTAGLTFEQQKELLAMQFEQDGLQLELRLEQERLQLELREKCSRGGDVEKMVAIPAVVQSFHQAPPVDLQVRGDPRAPEWANVIIVEERVIGRISVRCWNLREGKVEAASFSDFKKEHNLDQETIQQWVYDVRQWTVTDRVYAPGCTEGLRVDIENITVTL